jgi:hypothetical protein
MFFKIHFLPVASFTGTGCMYQQIWTVIHDWRSLQEGNIPTDSRSRTELGHTGITPTLTLEQDTSNARRKDQVAG